jgi:hypothetical protein
MWARKCVVIAPSSLYFQAVTGISGIVSWSLFSQGSSGLPQTVSQIAGYSLKSFFCLVVGLPAVVFHKIGVMAVLAILEALDINVPNKDTYWDRNHPIPHLIAIVVVSMIIVPLYITICLSIILSSSEPIKALLRILFLPV